MTRNTGTLATLTKERLRCRTKRIYTHARTRLDTHTRVLLSILLTLLEHFSVTVDTHRLAGGSMYETACGTAYEATIGVTYFWPKCTRFGLGRERDEKASFRSTIAFHLVFPKPVAQPQNAWRIVVPHAVPLAVPHAVPRPVPHVHPPVWRHLYRHSEPIRRGRQDF